MYSYLIMTLVELLKKISKEYPVKKIK